jgi:hypothetical protein
VVHWLAKASGVARGGAWCNHAARALARRGFSHSDISAVTNRQIQIVFSFSFSMGGRSGFIELILAWNDMIAQRGIL